MTAAKIRISGAWVDSTSVGKVRISGAWVDFGPPAGGGYEGLSWPSEPSNANAQDGDQDYVMGIKFRLTTAKPCYGIKWRVPDGLATPVAGVYNASLWKTSDTSRVANINFTPVAGGYQEILFSAPTSNLLTATDYVAAVYTNHYSFRAPSPSSGWHVMSPSGNVDAYEACLATGGPNVYPNNNFNGWYYVAPLIGT